MKLTKELLKKIFLNLYVRKLVGIFLVVFGLIGIVTPLTPWGFLFFVGLEILGVHFLFIEKTKKQLQAMNFFRKKALRDETIVLPN